VEPVWLGLVVWYAWRRVRKSSMGDIAATAKVRADMPAISGARVGDTAEERLFRRVSYPTK